MLMIGSLNTYTKNMKLQTQWELKQRNGDYSSHKTLEEWLGETQSKQQEEFGKGDDKLRDIHRKLDAGAKLTPEERRYLQAKDPEAYSKLEANEREQKAFEQKLRQCRTKEEAQRLRMTYLSSSLTIVKSVEHNSAIPQQKKLEIMMQEKRRCDMLEDSFQEFEKSGEYGSLPTETEESAAKKQEAEAKAPKKTEKDEQKPEKAEDKKPAGKKEKPQEAEAKVDVETPEQRKVKKARARAAAAAYSGSAYPDVTATASLVDLKA